MRGPPVCLRLRQGKHRSAIHVYTASPTPASVPRVPANVVRLGACLHNPPHLEDRGPAQPEELISTVESDKQRRYGNDPVRYPCLIIYWKQRLATCACTFHVDCPINGCNAHNNRHTPTTWHEAPEAGGSLKCRTLGRTRNRDATINQTQHRARNAANKLKKCYVALALDPGLWPECYAQVGWLRCMCWRTCAQSTNCSNVGQRPFLPMPLFMQCTIQWNQHIIWTHAPNC